jgi:hypothetical protein
MYIVHNAQKVSIVASTWGWSHILHVMFVSPICGAGLVKFQYGLVGSNPKLLELELLLVKLI